MSLKTAAILSPGDMGHTVGHVLVSHGLRVITCLQGRSERTKNLTNRAGIEDVPDYQTLVREADIVLSILVPSQAKQAAHVMAEVISQTKADFLYADCNAIAPQTTSEIRDMITAAGGRYVDAGIIGPPPTKKGINRFYVSGPEGSTFKGLAQFGLDVIVLGEEIGMASAIKMCYGALNKGVAALGIEILTAAEALGIYPALQKELELSQADLFARLERQFASMSMKSRRFVGEMEEIAKTLERVGLTPRIFDGAADLYRFVGTTELADRTAEDTSPLPSLTQMLSLLDGRLPKSPDKP